jgi:hypothetical protein
MDSSSVVGKGKGLGGACGSRAPTIARRGLEDGDKGLMGSGLYRDGCKVRVAWNFVKMPLPKSGVGQLGSTKKEWVKRVSPSMQVKRKVIKAEWEFPPPRLWMLKKAWQVPRTLARQKKGCWHLLGER